jgi:two-component system phosphate regulon sensor histidine kinase PhoR
MESDARILVVDDSEIIRETMEKLIGDAGYPVESAGGMHEALLLHAAKQFDLFLIDVVMPDVNGLTLLKELKIFDNTCEAVMVTGHESIDDAAKAMELGAFGYLVKPVGRDELLGMVRKALVMVRAKKNRFDRLRLLESTMRSRSEELQAAVSLLETQAQRLDAVINSMGDGLLAVDRDNAVVLLNCQAEKILDVRFGECAGQRLDSIRGRCSSPELLRTLKGDAGREKNRVVMGISYDVSGEGVRHYNVNISDLFDKDGKKTGKLALFSDQTEKISAEHLRNSFLTILAHELRTPLTIIMNYLPLLASEKNEGPERKEVIRDMGTASKRMKTLIDTIMSIALLSDPAMAIRKCDVNIRSLVQQEIAEISDAKDKTSPCIKVEDLFDRPVVQLDPTLAKIIISGLLSNAVKFNRENGLVTIRIEQTMLNGQQAVAMTFKDEGIGFSGYSQGQLFEVLSQGEDHLTRKTMGIGSGLFLVKRASELLGGTLEIRENPECGISAVVTLPASADLQKKQNIIQSGRDYER